MNNGSPAREFATTERPVVVVGRFPPPLDGQSIATRRLARLLERDCDLRRIDISTGESPLAESDVRLRSGRIAHYLRARKRLKSAVEATPNGTVLWAGISASTLGHFRDGLITLPSLRSHSRVFAVVHWGNFDELFKRFSTRWTAANMVKRVSGFVFLNQLLRDRCGRHIPDEKAVIIPNTIELAVQLTDDEVASKQMAHQKREVFRILYLGSMTGTKGWADVVKAVKLLSAGNADYRLDLVGRWEADSDKAAFADYILRHNLTGIVKHHGGISDRSVIKQLYAQADAFALPTYYPTEAQPLTVIEALNAGTPVITTRHAGLPEMIDDNVEGTFVPKQDPESIAAAVETLSDFETWRRMSVAARSRFKRQFHPDIVRGQWIELVNA